MDIQVWTAYKLTKVITLLMYVCMMYVGTLEAGELESKTWRVSHYCSCKKCCGKDVNDKAYSIMASGKRVYLGAIACNWIPFGTKVIIKGKTYIVEDRGAKSIFGTKAKPKYAIDIYCNSHNEALKKGVYYTKDVYIVR